MKLMKVAPGKWLHWPKEVDVIDALWLPPGGVLDADDPFTKECLKGQEYKLIDAPADAVQTPINNQRFLTLRNEFMRKAQPATDEKSSVPEEISKGIPRPDARPKRDKEKASAVPAQVPQSNPRP